MHFLCLFPKCATGRTPHRIFNSFFFVMMMILIHGGLRDPFVMASSSTSTEVTASSSVLTPSFTTFQGGPVAGSWIREVGNKVLDSTPTGPLTLKVNVSNAVGNVSVPTSSLEWNGDGQKSVAGILTSLRIHDLHVAEVSKETVIIELNSCLDLYTGSSYAQPPVVVLQVLIENCVVGVLKFVKDTACRNVPSHVVHQLLVRNVSMNAIVIEGMDLAGTASFLIMSRVDVHSDEGVRVSSRGISFNGGAASVSSGATVAVLHSNVNISGSGKVSGIVFAEKFLATKGAKLILQNLLMTVISTNSEAYCAFFPVGMRVSNHSVFAVNTCNCTVSGKYGLAVRWLRNVEISIGSLLLFHRFHVLSVVTQTTHGQSALLYISAKLHLLRSSQLKVTESSLYTRAEFRILFRMMLFCESGTVLEDGGQLIFSESDVNGGSANDLYIWSLTSGYTTAQEFPSNNFTISCSSTTAAKASFWVTPPDVTVGQFLPHMNFSAAENCVPIRVPTCDVNIDCFGPFTQSTSIDLQSEDSQCVCHCIDGSVSPRSSGSGCLPTYVTFDSPFTKPNNNPPGSTVTKSETISTTLTDDTSNTVVSTQSETDNVSLSETQHSVTPTLTNFTVTATIPSRTRTVSPSTWKPEERDIGVVYPWTEESKAIASSAGAAIVVSTAGSVAGGGGGNAGDIQVMLLTMTALSDCAESSAAKSAAQGSASALSPLSLFSASSPDAQKLWGTVTICLGVFILHAVIAGVGTLIAGTSFLPNCAFPSLSIMAFNLCFPSLVHQSIVVMSGGSRTDESSIVLTMSGLSLVTALSIPVGLWLFMCFNTKLRQGAEYVSLAGQTPITQRFLCDYVLPRGYWLPSDEVRKFRVLLSPLYGRLTVRGATRRHAVTFFTSYLKVVITSICVTQVHDCKLRYSLLIILNIVHCVGSVAFRPHRVGYQNMATAVLSFLTALGALLMAASVESAALRVFTIGAVVSAVLSVLYLGVWLYARKLIRKHKQLYPINDDDDQEEELEEAEEEEDGEQQRWSRPMLRMERE